VPATQSADAKRQATDFAAALAARRYPVTSCGEDLRRPAGIDGKGVIMMRAEQLRVTLAPAFILKIATALLMMFAATLVLVQAENYLSHSPLTQELTGELF
jgi:hypothetical protein